MDTDMYTLKGLSDIFGVRVGTLERLVKSENWKLERKNSKRYIITDADVVRLLYDIPKYRWLLQENSKNYLANYFLGEFKKEHPNDTRIFSKCEVSKLLGMSKRWFEYHQTKGDFSSQYIQRDEIFNYVMNHREHVRAVRSFRTRDRELYLLRNWLLENLQKAGVRV